MPNVISRPITGRPSEAAVNALPTNGTLCIPPGSYGFDVGTQITNNATLFCEPGAVFYDARNDRYSGDFITSQLFDFLNDNGGGVNGCTYVGTNTGSYWGRPGQIQEPNMKSSLLRSICVSVVSIAEFNRPDLWADSDVELTLGSDSDPGSNNNTIENNYTQGGWSFCDFLLLSVLTTLS